MWKLESSAVHRSTYYNVRFKRVYWLNGDDHTQDDFVLNGDEAAANVYVPIGFELTTYEEAIVHKLNCLSNEEYVFDILS